MASSQARIAIVGGGLGGLVAAAVLQTAGFNARVYEQTKLLSRLGAGIHVTPNVVKILQRIGVGQRLAETGVRPKVWINRKWDTGEVLVNYPLGDIAEAKYGAPYLMVHRGDFHALLLEAVKPDMIEFGKRLTTVDTVGETLRLGFEDGTTAEADIVIGADGVRSSVRENLIGPDQKVRYTNQVAYRSIFPLASLGGMELMDFTRWAANDRAFLQYFIRSGREEVYVVARAPEPEWKHAASWAPATVDEMRVAFKGFHPDVQRILNACIEPTKWAIFEADPLSIWSRGRVVLLGDACHPMTPNIGQGAAMAIEDAATLARCIETSPTDFDYAFRLYEANRKPRTSRIQNMSHTNTWLPDDEADWIFGYDAFGRTLTAPEAAAAGSGD